MGYWWFNLPPLRCDDTIHGPLQSALYAKLTSASSNPSRRRWQSWLVSRLWTSWWIWTRRSKTRLVPSTGMREGKARMSSKCGGSLTNKHWPMRVGLSEPQSSRQRAVGAVLHIFEAWVGRVYGLVTYRLMQILGMVALVSIWTRLKRWKTALHGYLNVNSWRTKRDLSPSVIIAAILVDEEGWGALVSLCYRERPLISFERGPNPSEEDVESDRKCRRYHVHQIMGSFLVVDWLLRLG